MAAEVKKINEYVQECIAITSITGAYVYGIDSNGNSIKIAVEVLAAAGTDYSAEIAELTRKCNNNTTLITALQTAVNGKANAVHSHQQSDISGLSDALAGKAAASHTHAQSDITGLTTALNGKADANHTHGMSAIVGLTDALNSKANSVHTHAIGDVANLQPTLANHEQRITNLEGQGGGGTVGNALKQVDLSTYSDGSNGEIVQHVGETTADYTNGYTYKCAAGEVEKTIPSGSQCIRLTQSGEEYISDGEADTSTDKMVMVLQPTAEGVTYNVFAARTIAETDIEKLVGCYVPDEIGAIHQITAITHNGTSLTSVTLDNGVTLEISSSTPTKSTLAWYEYFSKSGERYYGGSGSTGYMIASKDFVSAPSGDQFYPIATEPIGTAFGGTIQTFTASEDIVIRSVTWTQSNDQPPTSVASGDNFLTLINDELGASIDIAYNSSNQHLELKGKNGAVVSYVDMSQFIVDGMLDDVRLYTTAEQGVTVEVPYLKFTFNVASGKSVIRVSLKDLVDIYDGENINLTSAFVKAAQYSAPAIGDSMDVAIGKLLKGHEDNAAAIATKQDTLTFDDAPQSGSNRPVTSQGIKAAIDSAIGAVPNALKQVDLTTYQGTTNGEIVQHRGTTTANYTDGYVYQYTAGEVVATIPAGQQVLVYPNPSGGYIYRASSITKDFKVRQDMREIMVSGLKYYITYPESFTTEDGCKQLIGTYTADANGDAHKIVNVIYHQYQYAENVWDVDAVQLDNGVEIINTAATGGEGYPSVWLDEHGVEYYSLGLMNDNVVSNEFYSDYSYPHVIKASQSIGNLWNGGVQRITPSADIVIRTGGWQRINVQPSSEGAVSDLETRMTAAETAISGKQATITGAASTITDSNLTASKALVSDANGKVAASSVTATELGYLSGVTSAVQTQLDSKQGTLTFDDAPMAASNNVVKSGGVDAAIKNSQRVFYAVTQTAGATAVKEFTIPNFPTETINGVKTPLKGTILIAQCANADARTAQLKFKVNDGGEFPIWYYENVYMSSTPDRRIFGYLTRNYVYAFDGTYWRWVSDGTEDNTTYSAGTGLKLSSNQFSLNVPRVAKSCNSIPGKHTAIMEEYANGASYDLPSNNFYHILTMTGSNVTYATQLALGMTTDATYYRNYNNGIWYPWKRLDNPTMDSTPTAGNTSNVVSSDGIKTYVDTQVATKSNVIFRQWVTQ